MSVPFIKTGFQAGELAPAIWGHVDLAKFSIGASTMRNLFVSYHGGAYSRAGTKFVGFSKQMTLGRGINPRLITFQFSINQGLSLEFGHQYMRVVANGAFVTEGAQAISAITQADPGVLTVAGHGYSTGDWVYLAGIAGMTALDGETYPITVIDANRFSLATVFGVPVDTSGFPAYGGGGTAARIYTLATPWADGDLEFLKFTQSADVMSMCCWNQQDGTEYAPYDLARLADDDWTLTALSTGSALTPPGAPAAAATVIADASATPPLYPTAYAYVVTTVDPASGDESVASAIANVTNSVDIASEAGSVTLGWNLVPGSVIYNIYKAPPAFNTDPASTTDAFPVPGGAQFGYAGTSYGAEWVDTNIIADMTQVPPLHQNPFLPGQILYCTITGVGSGITSATATYNTSTGGGAHGYPVIQNGELAAWVIDNPGGGYADTDTITFTVNGGATAPTGTLAIGPESGTYPSCVSYYQERRVYAGAPNTPDTYAFSQPGRFANFDIRNPTIDSDAIIGTPWSVQVDGIQAMVSMPGGLVVLTGLAAWQLTGTGGSSLNPQPITPANQQAQPQAYNGCSATLPPIKIDYHILFVQAKGSIVRDLNYNYFLNIYTGVDTTELQSQLFTGYTLKEWAWCEEPYKVVWATRQDGTMLSLTYLPQQELAAWARHDTQGAVWSVCSVTEPPVDALYLATERFIGAPSYMIERMDNRIWQDDEDCWCVDAGLALPQATPDAQLSASSATGSGALLGVTGLVGGKNYSTLTTASVVDDNGTGPGSGATVALTIAGGAITAVSFPDAGAGYTYPALVFQDPAGTGSGAAASPVLDTSVTFTASAGVFGAGNLGEVIRLSGGIATITEYVDAEHVVGALTRPITAVLPITGSPLAQGPGNWTLTAPAQVIGGLNHLIGATVTGLADGAVISPRLVAADGTVTLDAPASAVVIGLAFTPQLQSVYANAGEPTIQGQRKKVAAVTVRIEASRGLSAGCNQPDGSALSPPQNAPRWSGMTAIPDTIPGGVRAPYGSTVPPLYTGDRRVALSGGFATPGQVAIEQLNPLPMNISALIPEILPGDIPQAHSGGDQARAAGRRAA